MKLLEDFRTIIVGFIGSILFTLYLENRSSVMGFTIIFIIFSSWLMLVIWNQKKKIEQRRPFANWLTGEDVVKYYDLSQDLLMQFVRNGLPVYPAGNDVLTFGNEVPPLNEEELAFEIDNEDYSKYRFKKEDIEKHIKQNT